MLKLSEVKTILKYFNGKLKLRKESSGYRHYIEPSNGKMLDIRCGSLVEVKLGNQWIQGRYECSLTDQNTRVRLHDDDGGCIIIPLESKVRKPINV